MEESRYVYNICLYLWSSNRNVCLPEEERLSELQLFCTFDIVSKYHEALLAAEQEIKEKDKEEIFDLKNHVEDLKIKIETLNKILFC